MRRGTAYILAIAGSLSCAVSGTEVLGAPGGPIGVWNRDDGLGGVRIGKCGAALCGHIAWLRNPDGPGRVGQRVLYQMRKTAPDTWSGSAHNPEDGGTYSGTMVLSNDRLTTRGCAASGLLCQSVGLTRAR